MLAVIDETVKPQLPQIYLAKPNRNIIGKLNHFIYLPHQHDFNLGSLNEITFKMPYEVENPFEHKLEKNPFIDVILERYLLKIKLGADEEWYVINEIEDDMDSEKDTKTIHAYSLGYEINDKLIRDYEVVSYSLKEVATDALRYTLWSVGEIDEKFKDKRRSFEVSEKTALSFLEEIAEKFGALIEYDTVNRRVHFRDPARIGTYRGLNINYGKYLKSLGKNSKADEMVTRLYVYGENGMSINRVNPTGMPYIEDFSYFMYPFEMDENGKVIKHSQYMSDELCKAIIKYDELVKSKDGIFTFLLDEMEFWQSKLMDVESELFLLETELKIIQERLDVQRSYGSFLYHENTYNNDSETIEFDLNRSSKSAIFARTDNSNLTINIDGITIPQTPINEWKVLRRISEQEITRIRINGTGTIQLYIVEITDEDYELSDQYIIDKYCEHKQQEEVNMVQAQWDEYNTELTIIENEIYDLKEELSIENNFSPKLIQERNQFIIEKTWQDNSYFDDKELFEDAKEKFTELKMPKTSIDIDIVNFKEILEEQHNWNRLALGDEIRIEYDVMNVNIQAKVIKITYNYQNKTIRLRIANIKEIEGKNAKLLEMLKSSYSTSTSVDMSKYKWNDSVEKTNQVARMMEGEYDATKRRIIAGANETVTIDNRGITIRNPDFPKEIIRMNSGVLALSKSDGQNWETAITPDGVVAEKIVGNIIAGQSLKITNEKGSFVFDENGLNIEYNSLYVEDEDGGNKLEKIDEIESKFGEISGDVINLKEWKEDVEFRYSEEGIIATVTGSSEWSILSDKVGNKVDTSVYENKMTEISTTLDGISTNINSITQKINDNDTEIEELSTQIETVAGEVKTKAESKEVNELGKRIGTVEQNISALDNQISQKVSIEVFDQLENRVEEAESEIQQTAENVSFTFKRLDNIDGVLNSAVTTIDASGITVKDGSFFLEDDNVDTKYSIVSKTNLIGDHSFELLRRIEGSINPTYGDFDFVGGNTSNSWKKVGNPRLLSFYATDFPEAGQIIFGNQAVVVNSSNYVRQSIRWWEGVTYTLSAYYTVYSRSSSGYPRLRVRIVDAANNTTRILATKDFSKVTEGILSRVSLTFTIPDGLNDDDSVSVELLTTNANYLVVDGVQLVEGTHPTLYEPETSLFEFMNSVSGYELSRLHFRKDSYRSNLEGLYMNNSDIIGVNALYFNDPGNSEGIIWEGGNGWRIVEAPDNMTNGRGNLQLATNNTRRMTLETDGTLNVTNHITGNDKRWRATVDQNYGYIQTVRGEMRVTKYQSTTLIPIRASSHPTGSSILTKQNIEELNVEDAYFLLNNADVYTYHINSNIDDGIFDKKKIGMISEMVPSLLRDEDGIDTYSIISALWKVVQNEVKLRKKNEKNLEDLMIVMDEIIKENKYLMSKLEQMEAKSS